MPPLSAGIAALLNRFAGAENVLALETAIIARDRQLTLQLARQVWADAMPALRERFNLNLTATSLRAYEAAWNRLPGDDPAGYPAPQGAIDRAQRQAARRVTAMTTQSRRVIRMLVTAAIAGGASNPRLASTLVASGLGMNRPQVGAHIRMANDFMAKVKDGKMTQARALRRIEADRKRKIRRRSRTIARTETSDARGYARQRAWSDAARSGKIKRKDWEKVWRTSADEFVDEVCIPLNGATATVSGAFFTGDIRPPKHPNCRCTCTLRRKRGD